MIDAQWLFENHLNHLALKKYLLGRMEHLIYPNETADADEIFSQALRRPPLDMPSQKNCQGSSTERIALLLLQENTAQKPNEALKAYENQLSCCTFLIELYDAVLVSLTDKEAWLVEAFYHQGLTIDALQRAQDSPYDSCDRSTVYRTKNKIIQKANRFIKIYIPKEVSQCRLETFMSELKQFQDRNTTN